MRIQSAARIPRGAGGVAQGGGGALIELRPLESFGATGDQVLVAAQSFGHPDRGHVRRLAQTDPGAHQGALRRELLDERRKAPIEEHHTVFGMIDDVDQLREMQPRIAGVQHHAAARHREISLEVPMRVAGNGADAAACFEAQGFERIRQASRAGRALCIGVSMEGPLRLARDDFHLAKLGGGMLDDAGDQERPIHHQARTQHCENLPIGLPGEQSTLQFDTKRALETIAASVETIAGTEPAALSMLVCHCRAAAPICHKAAEHIAFLFNLRTHSQLWSSGDTGIVN